MPRSPSPSSLSCHADVARALATSGLGISPSELHGSLSGLLCAGASADGDWLSRLELAVDDADLVNSPAMQTLRDMARVQFEPDSGGVDPLLPPAGRSLEERAQALVEWCRGFLGGFGLGDVSVAMGGSTSEVLADLGTIAASNLTFDDEAEDERAFEDVLAFVREAVALLHREARERTLTLVRRLH